MRRDSSLLPSYTYVQSLREAVKTTSYRGLTAKTSPTPAEGRSKDLVYFSANEGGH